MRNAFEVEQRSNQQLSAKVYQLQALLAAAETRIGVVTAENQRLNLLVGHLVLLPHPSNSFVRLQLTDASRPRPLNFTSGLNRYSRDGVGT